MSSPSLSPAPQPIVACTVSHDIEDFALLIEDMEHALGETWGDLRFEEVLPFLEQPDAASLRFLVIAVDDDDKGRLDEIGHILGALKQRGIRAILVTEAISSDELSALLQQGGDEYVPYPPAKGILAQAIDRIDQAEPSAPLILSPNARQADPAPLDETPPAAVDAPAPAPEPAAPAPAPVEPEPQPDTVETSAPEPDAKAVSSLAQQMDDVEKPARGSRLSGLTSKLRRGKTKEPDAAAETVPAPDAPARVASEPGPAPDRIVQTVAPRVIAVQGMAGGVGATTLAVNLARELAGTDKKTRRSVCLLDFDFQFGTVGLLCDLGPKAAVVELLSDTETVDDDSFRLALQQADDSVSVLTAPEDLIPMDFVNAEDVGRLIDTARSMFDFVVIDMPRILQDWTETVLRKSDAYLAVLQLDVSSAQNCMRFRRALQAEEIETDALRFVLNRAPRRTELTARSRMQSMAQSLGISFEVQLPNGSGAVAQAADQGEFLAKAAPKSPYRKAIQALAKEIHSAESRKQA